MHETSYSSFTMQFLRSFSKECSIYDSYAKAIEKSTKFIYIENQYFLDSKIIGKDLKNDIPTLIKNKIIKKIESKEKNKD
jgi:phosphatidylserine/phosphatidylglycerophosphate/cardiolipin synthase-like enzyme